MKGFKEIYEITCDTLWCPNKFRLEKDPDKLNEIEYRHVAINQGWREGHVYDLCPACAKNADERKK